MIICQTVIDRNGVCVRCDAISSTSFKKTGSSLICNSQKTCPCENYSTVRITEIHKRQRLNVIDL